MNGVADRVRIGELFAGEDFAKFVDGRSLVIMDIEGGEKDLLDPERFPALRELDILVETHPGEVPGITQEIIRRFTPSHAIACIQQGPKATPLPNWVKALGHIDALIAVWEWRAAPTPWLIMRPLRRA